MVTKIKSPVFLLCSERSGSNLIREILGAHSEIASPMPIHLLGQIGNSLYRYGDLTYDKNWKMLVKHIVLLIKYQIGKLDVSISEEELLKNVKSRSFKSIFEYIYLKTINANNKSRLFLKENQNYNNIGFILENFPDAKFIVQVRDPRDMILSMKKSPTYDPDFFQAIKLWKQDQTETLKIKYQINNNRVHIHRYEDLLESPVDTLQSICNFLDINFENSLLEFNKTENANKSAKLAASWQNLNKGIIKNNKQKYKKELTKTEIKITEHNLFDLMQFYGYNPDFDKFGTKTKFLALLGKSDLMKVLGKRKFIKLLYPLIGVSNNKMIEVNTEELERRKKYKAIVKSMKSETRKLVSSNLSV